MGRRGIGGLGDPPRGGYSMKRHLLVTNDYPPKVGGIQNYLWELWRRLPGDRVTILTPQHRASASFDSTQNHRIVRDSRKVLFPTPALASRIRNLAREIDAELVILDPALPLGHLGPSLGLPYAVVVHGAEVTVPRRLPLARNLLGRVLRGAEFIISAGGYAAAEASKSAGHATKTIEVPPGVDPVRFSPLSADRRRAQRLRFGLDEGPLVLSLSRLIPRKGFDRTIEAVAGLRDEFPNIQLAIAGLGRDAKRLARIARRCDFPVTFLGRVSEPDLPSVFGIADVFSMPCRNRWGGLEQEGFGIVFLEAASCGVPQIAGLSGGAPEAVIDGISGLVVQQPNNSDNVANAIRSILGNLDVAERMSKESRNRAVSDLSYDLLAQRLERALS